MKTKILIGIKDFLQDDDAFGTIFVGILCSPILIPVGLFFGSIELIKFMGKRQGKVWLSKW